MNEEVIEELKKLMGSFYDSYINRNLEVIIIPKTNTYFSLEGVQSRRDLIAKILMWCSRDISKGMPYKSQKRNLSFLIRNQEKLNKYLGTKLSHGIYDLIYQKLGNGINPELTYQYIDSGFDWEVLYNG
ncbi:hypothetical protein AB6M97_01940 [Streptococcus hillyeri]|uniref:hypothetical protein n=1 Tax=Streptococcus hillyeri TaxID=2282420 RepID=UPI0034E272C1